MLTVLWYHPYMSKKKKKNESLLFLFSPDLKKNGIFPASSQTPLTPGPPKKKQKISHDKNNHQPNHTPHKSPNNHNPTHIFFNDSYEVRVPAPKTNKYKQHESTGYVKRWKAKRPVTSSRDTPGKLILDEADDFPRGGVKGETIEMKKKRRKRKPKQVPSVPPEGHRDGRPDYPCWTGEMQTCESKPEKGKRKRRARKFRIANQKLEKQMYPKDENLFIIKQRRRRR